MNMAVPSIVNMGAPSIVNVVPWLMMVNDG